jgi:uncharacterized protein YbbC (DUF1343 family)
LFEDEMKKNNKELEAASIYKVAAEGVKSSDGSSITVLLSNQSQPVKALLALQTGVFAESMADLGKESIDTDKYVKFYYLFVSAFTHLD